MEPKQPQLGFTAEQMQTKEMIEAMSRMAMQLSPEDVQDLLARYHWIESVGPIVDPTAYREVMDTLPGHLQLATAFGNFRAALEKLAYPEGARDETHTD